MVLKEYYNGSRLRKALDYRCMTISDLSRETKISRQTLTEYKSDEITHVDVEKIKKIADILEFPLKFFFEKDTEIKSQAIYFRSLLTTKKQYRKAQRVKLELIARIFEFLNEYVEFPEFDVPDCGGLSPEDASQKIREAWGLANKPIKNIITLLENHGMLIVCLDTETDAIDAFTQKFILEDGSPVFVIGYSSNKKSAARINFDIAHELGHICLHSWIDEVDSDDKEEFKRREDEANRFASSLLLPKETFLPDLLGSDLNLRSYINLKKKWGVSIAAMLLRANRLRVIDNNQLKNMIIKMQKIGIRKQEPLDGELITAEPSILKTAVSLLLSNEVFNKEEFMDYLEAEVHLPLYPYQVEQLLELPKGTLQESKVIQFNSLSLKKN